LGQENWAEIFLPIIFLPSPFPDSWFRCAACGLWRLPANRSADWQSAVSRIGNPQAALVTGGSADCQSATQQVANLRYMRGRGEGERRVRRAMWQTLRVPRIRSARTPSTFPPMPTAGPVPADALSLREFVSRREWLRVGGLGALGLSLGGLHSARAASDKPATGGTFGKAKHCILLYLAGGPPQHETFDPKPDAPREVRGQFNPISTSVPGIQFCELLPRTARLAHRLAVVRSMFTDVNSHSTSGYWMLTGM